MPHCDYYDTDPPAFLHETEQIARKEHKCCECGGPIQKGQLYRRVSGAWDRQAQTFKQCERCADLWDSLDDAGWCPYYGDMFETYRESLNGQYPDNHIIDSTGHRKIYA